MHNIMTLNKHCVFQLYAVYDILQRPNYYTKYRLMCWLKYCLLHALHFQHEALPISFDP